MPNDIQKIESNSGQVALNVEGNQNYYNVQNINVSQTTKESTKKVIKLNINIEPTFIIEFEDFNHPFLNQYADPKDLYLLNTNIGTGIDYPIINNIDEIKDTFFEILAENKLHNDFNIEISTSKYLYLLEQYKNANSKLKVKISTEIAKEKELIDKYALLCNLVYNKIPFHGNKIEEMANQFILYLIKIHNQSFLYKNHNEYFEYSLLVSDYMSNYISKNVYKYKNDRLGFYPHIYLAPEQMLQLKKDKRLYDYSADIQVEVISVLIDIFINQKLSSEKINLKHFFTLIDKQFDIKSSSIFDKIFK